MFYVGLLRATINADPLNKKLIRSKENALLVLVDVEIRGFNDIARE